MSELEELLSDILIVLDSAMMYLPEEGYGGKYIVRPQIGVAWLKCTIDRARALQGRPSPESIYLAWKQELTDTLDALERVGRGHIERSTELLSDGDYTHAAQVAGMGSGYLVAVGHIRRTFGLSDNLSNGGVKCLDD